MKAEKKYQLLIRLAQDKHDAAARELGQVQKNLHMAEQKLAQIQQFLAEYRAQRVARGVHGMSVARWTDYQHFLDRLEEAVQAQQREVDFCVQVCEEARQNWQLARQKLKAMEVLRDKEVLRELQKLAKQEQKRTDELATRAFTFKPNA